jgi:hypothetical protein
MPYRYARSGGNIDLFTFRCTGFQGATVCLRIPKCASGRGQSHYNLCKGSSRNLPEALEAPFEK